MCASLSHVQDADVRCSDSLTLAKLKLRQVSKYKAKLLSFQDIYSMMLDYSMRNFHCQYENKMLILVELLLD